MKSLLVLLVDDDADDKEMFCEALNEISKRHECIWAKNGYEALEHLDKNSANLPDYIFLDINMPRLNGKQCLQRLKAAEQLKKIPVYIYSTSKRDGEHQEMLQLGASGFLCKPDNYLDLKTSLKKIILYTAVSCFCIYML